MTTLAAEPIRSGSPVTDQEAIMTPRLLNDSQVRAFVDNGFHIQEGLITPAELEELKADVVRVARGKYPCQTIEPVSDELSDSEVLRSVLCIHQPHYISPVILKYVKHPKICGILSQITAAHLPHWDGSVKCMQSMYFVKPPQFQGQAWHQDEVYIPTRDRSLIGAWIAVDDATIRNGCLWVVPGSHQTGYLYPMRKHDNDEEFDFAPEAYGFDQSREVPVEVKAGAVVFFNGYLLHRSRKNRSDIYRRVLVNHYMNAWSLLPWHAKDEARQESAARADSRCIVPVAGIDPYAWKGVEQPDNKVYMRSCKANRDELERHAKKREGALATPDPAGKPAEK